MSQSNRREFLARVGSAAAFVPALRTFSFNGSGAAAPAASPQAAQGAANAAYDLLITGGRVIDPSQNLSAVRDVAIVAGKIAKVDANIPPGQARRTYDAKGKLVTPGLIDLHTHVYRHGITLAVDPDVVGVQNSVTTLLDCGSTGATDFMGFRKYVIESEPTRIYALLNISSIGLIVTNEIYLDPRMINPALSIRIIEQNRDRIVGIKVRVNGKKSDLSHDLEVMKSARQVADATGVPIMMHWSVEPELLATLKRGDILTHPMNPAGMNSSNIFGNDVDPQSDKVLPQILALKDRGIVTDCQLATTHTAWTVAEKAAKQGWFPDTLSTDIGRTPDGSPASVLVSMTVAMQLGMPLDAIVAAVTSTPARVMNFPEKVGTLAPGTTADVSVLDIQQGNFAYPDQTRQTMAVKQQFVSVATIKGGIFMKGAPPPPAPAGRGAAPTTTGGGGGVRR